MNILLEKHKIFKDVIYNSIETTYLANLIIDTDIFQRLRHLNQLGVCFLIFPNANNKRFEHSLGVYHLTGHLRNCRNRSVLGKQRALLHSTLNIESTWHVVGIPKGERH